MPGLTIHRWKHIITSNLPKKAKKKTGI